MEKTITVEEGKQQIHDAATFLRDFISFMPKDYPQRDEAIEEARKIRYLIAKF